MHNNDPTLFAKMTQDRELTSDHLTPGISIGPRVRKSPFYPATRRHGAKAFTVYNHMYLPTAYTDPVDEYWKLVKAVTLWDVACQRQIEITGPDALRLMQRLIPRDLANCRPGQCRYVVITGEDGGIINDAVLLLLGEQHFWLSPGDGDALLWVQGVAINSGLDVHVSEPDVSPLQLQGPKSPQVARALFGDDVLELPYYGLREFVLDDMPLVVSRTGWSGELGYEIYLRDSRFGEQLWERVMTAGEPHGIAPIAPSAIRSIEGGLLSYVSDISRTDNPFVVGLDRLCKLDKPGGFIGREALLKIKAEGVKRRLAGVEIHGDPLRAGNEEFWRVGDASRDIGHITRCVWSPRLAKNIGFANIPVEHAAYGTRLVVSTPHGDRQATACAWPWIKAQKTIPVNL